MLLVDYRQGSQELIEPLQQMGLDVDQCDLPAGDISFVGKGEKGKQVTIGVEFKKLDELVGSLRTERLQGHQLLKMQDMYDFKYLLIEGELLIDKAGKLLKRVSRRETRPMHGQLSISEFFKRLNVLHLRGGLNWQILHSRRLILKWIEALYRTWTDKALDEHKSHLALYSPPPIVPISEFRDVVRRFPRVGFKASLAVEQAFGGSLKRAVMASEEEWAAIATTAKDGKRKRLGMEAAKAIRAFLK